MTDLIKRLEEATEGSRKLDVEIFAAHGRIDEDHCRQWCSMDGRTDLTRERYISAWAPNYTTSLDAAMTLVPEGWEWLVSNRAQEPHTGRAYLNNRQLQFAGIGGTRPNPAFRGHECTAATPAIALCIAALKAKDQS